jgi:phosphate transport system permease protein
MFDMTELSRQHLEPRSAARLRRRRRGETRLKALGVGAIALAMLSLVILLASVVGKAANALYEYTLPLEITLELSDAQRAVVEDRSSTVAPDLSALVERALREKVAAPADDADLTALLNGDVGWALGRLVKADPSLIGETVRFEALLDDDAQLYLKGYYGEMEAREVRGVLAPTGAEGEIELVSSEDDFVEALTLAKAGLSREAAVLRRQAARQDYAVEVYREQIAGAVDEALIAKTTRRLERALEKRDALLAEAAALEARAGAEGGFEEIGRDLPSVFVETGGGWARLTGVGPNRATAATLEPLTGEGDVDPSAWRLMVLDAPEAGRNVTDAQAVWLERLSERGAVGDGFNWRFFFASDSRDAALAGLWGAIVGSALTMLVTFLLAFPIGVAASIYLEEFAPKNQVTRFIEVNINNLAAVPSIVFGLLGLAVALPLLNQLMGINLRSAPLIGGVVLALMSLPTIIIASRAAIRAVPPSIREAALGVGASRLQATFHHVLPLALPGVMTGAIIALAQALGETAPLLMIGMVAFIVDIPGGVTDPATVLPVQVYRWSDFPEKLFELKTALAICTLLAFLVVMNGLAVVLRKKFERRW